MIPCHLLLLYLCVVSREFVGLHELRFSAQVRRIHAEESRVREALALSERSASDEHRRPVLRAVRVLLHIEAVERDARRRTAPRLHRVLQQQLRAPEIESALQLHGIEERSLPVARLRLLRRTRLNLRGAGLGAIALRCGRHDKRLFLYNSHHLVCCS